MAARLLQTALLVLSWFAFSERPLAAEEHPIEPLEPGDHTVELNGMRIWYKVAGTGPLCLMPTPAWGPSSDIYFRTLASMEKVFTVVYIDSRGTGRSDRAKAPGQYTWEHLVGDLESLRLHLRQDSVWLMGHSEGGIQVLHYACKHPERVRGLVLMATAGVWDDAVEADVQERQARRKGQPWYEEAVNALAQGMAGGVKTDYEAAKLVKASAPLYWSDPKKAERFEDDFAATTISAAAMGDVASKRFPFDLRAELKKVSAPAMIVVGDDDFICSPESATRLHLALPNSKLLLIERCGHFPWLEQPKVFETRVPEFLAAIKSSQE